MPYWSAELKSPFPPKEVVERLRSVMLERPETFTEQLLRKLEPWAKESLFEGTIDGFSFKIRRVIRYRNTFLPVIRGTITYEPSGGSSVDLWMTLTVFSAIFAAIFTSVVVFIVAMNFSELDLLRFAIVIGAIAVPLLSFYAEAIIAERILRKALLESAP